MNWLKNKLDNLLAIIFGLAGELYAGQFPEYQYPKETDNETFA